MLKFALGVLVGWLIWGNSGTIKSRCLLVKDTFLKLIGRG
jgi:hypothetical protein